MQQVRDQRQAVGSVPPAGIRLTETARETDNAAWLEQFTLELRLLEVPGDAIGDAGLGLLGLIGFRLSALPLVQGAAVRVDLPTISMFVVVIVGAVLMPTFLRSLVRVPPRAWMLVVAAVLGIALPLAE
ncbi:hypothetical protein [Cryobacterium sp. Y82]|uniref:hypothetical protein n=1 Tax=Cryobacterium sp. Y82 TaxID=2045017 RepID=UPI000CE3A6AF|nr:hypothetical protein [Cryobacterium sp. Y82]